MTTLCPFNDLECASCGYNLRGLSADECCPECSFSVGGTLVQRVGRSDDDDDAWPTLLAAANAAKVSLAAMHLVHLAVHQAQLSQCATDLDSLSCEASAQDICDAVLELIEEDAKSLADAKRRLRAMGLLSSADVGRSIAALVTVQFVFGSEQSTLRFNDLDTIERWLA